MALIALITANISLFILIGTLLIVVLLAWVIRLELKLKRFLQGKDAGNLEDLIIETLETVKQTDHINEEITQHLLKVEERLRKSVQHVKTVRFTPFPDQGGNQSF